MHWLIHFAAEKGKQTELVGVLFRNCFVDERSLFDDDHLIELAVEVDVGAAGDGGVPAGRELHRRAGPVSARGGLGRRLRRAGVAPRRGLRRRLVYVFVQALAPTLLLLQLGFTVAPTLHDEWHSHPADLWNDDVHSSPTFAARHRSTPAAQASDHPYPQHSAESGPRHDPSQTATTKPRRLIHTTTQVVTAKPQLKSLARSERW
ncbi:hypothetical protein ABIA31_008105 [Catenulispora sp. MAP5-51]|uniref:hypothetical protein n=1 Tax=Catenulispora sp. MAP5-51 TaxID=3156298 RepID=UPI003512BB9C